MIWARTLLVEIGFPQDLPSVIHEDNVNAITIASSYKQHSAVKHIALREHFIRDRVLQVKDISIKWIATGLQTADLFTKQLPYPAFSRHRQGLGMTDPKGCVDVVSEIAGVYPADEGKHSRV